MPTIEDELASQHEVHNSKNRRLKLVFDDPIMLMSIVDGEEAVLTKRFTSDETMAMMSACQSYPAALETLAEIKGLCDLMLDPASTSEPPAHYNAYESVRELIAKFEGRGTA